MAKFLYAGVCDILRKGIVSGALPIGSKLPTETELCSTHKISRITAIRALNQLESEGLIRRKSRVGSIVTGHVPIVNDRLVHLIVDSQGHVHEDFYLAIVRELDKWGYRFLKWSPQSLTSEAACKELLSQRSQACIVTEPISPVLQGHLADLAKPVVALFPSKSRSFDCPVIYSDVIDGAAQLANQAIDAGYSSILHYTFFDQSPQRNAIAERICAVCLKRGISFSVRNVFDGANEELEISRAEEALRNLGGVRTAVLCSSDFCGIHVLRAAARLGISVPEQLAVTGFYATPWSHSYDMTTVSLNFSRMAELVVQSFRENYKAKEMAVPVSVVFSKTMPGVEKVVSEAPPITSRIKKVKTADPVS